MIVATRNTLHVYSTSNSLLTRSIKLKVVIHANSTPRIVSFCLSPNKSHILWVACTDGSIFSVDWTSGAGAEQFWGISAGCIYMTVASMESTGRRRDVVFTTEVRPSGGFRVTANELAAPGDSFETGARTIYTSTERINFLKTAKEGSVIVGSSGKRILVGSLRSTEYGTIDKIRYEFRIFESTDAIKSLDVKVLERTAHEAEGLKKAVKKTPVVNLVVGDVNGVVFLHNDLLAKLFIQSQDGSLPPGMSLAPRKLHWHRQEVHSVKWSLDGMSHFENYMNWVDDEYRQLRDFWRHRDSSCDLAA
jgi:NET1-associated nuclear protein 1 (U3 small nucleolar RNA-associated protein 17)